jgi:hypothetical protein
MCIVGFAWFYWLGYRYYFFGKNAARWARKADEETWKERAISNKRQIIYFKIKIIFIIYFLLLLFFLFHINFMQI